MHFFFVFSYMRKDHIPTSFVIIVPKNINIIMCNVYGCDYPIIQADLESWLFAVVLVSIPFGYRYENTMVAKKHPL